MKAGLIGAFAVLGFIGFGIWAAIFYEPESVPITTRPLSAASFDAERAAMLIHERVNLERQRAGVAPVAWNEDLARVAQAHSQDMAERGYYDHVSPEGQGFRSRYVEAGISCSGSENLVMGLSVGSESQQAQMAVSAWMSSTEGHRENMLNSRWTSEGIGVAIALDGNVYVTQNFC